MSFYAFLPTANSPSAAIVALDCWMGAGAEKKLRRLGSYVILEELPPYGAVQPSVARRDGEIELCTLKRLLVHLESDENAKLRFEREAKIAKRLIHPNITRMLAAGEEDGAQFIVTEFLASENLATILERLEQQRRTMPLEVFAAIALRMLEGIDYAHRATGTDGTPIELVHRNLTPRCVLVSFGGEVKISDFGAAKASIDHFKTDPGMAVGTLEYMSPEQVLSRSLDQRSDVYALGVVFYEMLTGMRAVPDGTVMETLSAIANKSPEPLINLRPELGPRLVEAIERALKKDPHERWTSAAALKTAIAGALSPSMVLSSEALGEFLRQLLPEGEKRALSLLGRIREVGSELESPRGNEEPTMVIEQKRATMQRPVVAVETMAARFAPESSEPDVMTMPGVALSPNRSVSTAANKIIHDRKRLARAARIQRYSYFAVIGLAIVLGFAAWIVSMK